MKFHKQHQHHGSKSSLEDHVHIEDNRKVVWNDGSTEHPRNWTRWPKYYTTTIIIGLEFFMTAISSSGTAAANGALKDYPMSITMAYFAFVTVYLLGQTIGGFCCPPISEVFGRRTIYIIATTLFGVSSAVVATPHHVAAVYVGRFIQGFAAAIPATVAFGNFNDLFDAEYRIWVVYLYTLFGMAGLALGPIYSTYVTLKLGWRWVFYISAIASGICLLFCVFMRESSATHILQKEAKSMGNNTGKHLYADGTEPDDKNKNAMIQEFFQNQIYRPLAFLFTEPLVTLCAILCAIAFGLIYGLTESLTIVYTTPPFDLTFSETTSSLAFLAILIGEILNVLPRIYDHILLRRFRRQNLKIKPETKIRSFAIACPALALGLWIFSWTIPPHTTHTPWPISMLGLILIGFAANDFSHVLFGYMTDSYGASHAASAVGALGVARTVAAAVFPLFTTQMYHGLNNNHATTIFAAVATAFCFTPFLFLKYGEKLRRRSRFAEKDDCLREENAHLDDREHDQIPMVATTRTNTGGVHRDRFPANDDGDAEGVDEDNNDDVHGEWI